MCSDSNSIRVVEGGTILKKSSVLITLYSTMPLFSLRPSSLEGKRGGGGEFCPPPPFPSGTTTVQISQQKICWGTLIFLFEMDYKMYYAFWKVLSQSCDGLITMVTAGNAMNYILIFLHLLFLGHPVYITVYASFHPHFCNNFT